MDVHHTLAGEGPSCANKLNNIDLTQQQVIVFTAAVLMLYVHNVYCMCMLSNFQVWNFIKYIITTMQL